MEKTDSHIAVPSEIIQAAHKVANWATKKDWRDWRIGPVADRRLLEEKTELPRTIKKNSFWLVIYEHRPAVITISADGSGFFACGQEELWPMREVKAWIREIRVVDSAK